MHIISQQKYVKYYIFGIRIFDEVIAMPMVLKKLPAIQSEIAV